ncbi:MAG: ATP-binding protein [Desulfatiglans sp.]|jgi:PAS domain S-box-containing protein|nr:ATP-binding protein [Desulfatiglans sp.]
MDHQSDTRDLGSGISLEIPEPYIYDRSRELFEKILWMDKIRKIVAFSLLMLTLFSYLFIKTMPLPVVPLVIICLIELLVNTPYGFIFARISNVRLLGTLQATLDMILITAFTHYAGGPEFPFSIAVYFFGIAFVGVVLGRWSSYWLAGVSLVSYVLMTWMEYAGLIPHTPVFNWNLSSSAQVGIVVFHGIVFVLSALFGGDLYTMHRKNILRVKEIGAKFEDLATFNQGILDNILDGIIITDLEGRITDLNRAVRKTSGYEKDELLGKFTSELMASDDVQNYSRDIRALGSVGNPWQVYEYRARVKDGSFITVSARYSFFRDSEGRAKAIIGVFRDVTAQKQAEESLRRAHEELEVRVGKRTEELAQANKALQEIIAKQRISEAQLMSAKQDAEAANRAKSEFLANMSHELRTPLNHIIGFTELVADKKFGDLNETQEEYLGDVLQSSRHLLSLINDILDLSKVEAGKLEWRPSDVSLRMVLENSLTMIKEKCMKRSIQLALEVNGIPEVLKADEQKLKQIIYNLLSNAVKFTPNNGSVQLEAHSAYCSVRPGLRHGDMKDLKIVKDISNRKRTNSRNMNRCVEISVIDTGIGIGSKDLKRIFNPFEQVESSATRRFQGTGLGLSFTKRLVELHGGRIWAESKGEGQGAIFRFIIPGE